MYVIEYITSKYDHETYGLTAPETNFVDAECEEDARKIFDELLFEREDLFLMSINLKGKSSDDPMYLLGFLDISNMREERIRLKKSMEDLEVI